MSSPRPWGCSGTRGTYTIWLPVFPTPVGVFRLGPDLAGGLAGLPHARGGVPSLLRSIVSRRAVFPTPVGVFLILIWPLA